MKVLIISTFGLRDGIEAYTKELCYSLKNLKISILCRSIIFGLLYIIRNIIREKPNIVHIQHEYSLFKPRPFGLTAIPFLLLLRLLGVKVILTMHTVYPIREFENYVPSKYQKYPNFIKYIAKLTFLIVTKILSKLSHHIIVLTLKGKKILEYEYGIHNVSFIPYGIHKSNIYPDVYAKERLGFSNTTVLACFGYPYPNKGFHYAIEAVEKLIKSGYKNIILLLQDIRLAHDYEKCEMYVNMLKRLVKEKKIENFVRFLPFIPETELPLYLSAVDIFIYPYEPRVASSSALMKTLYFGKWYVLSDIPAFEVFKYLGLHNIIFVKPRSSDDIAKAIIKIINENKIVSINKELLDKFSWENIGKVHVYLYKKLMND